MGLSQSAFTCPINSPGSHSQCWAVTKLHLSSHVLCLLTVLPQPGWGHSGARCSPSRTDRGTGGRLLLRPLHAMEALCVQPWEKDLVIGEGEQARRRGGLEEEGAEAPSPTGSETDEDTDEDSEPEPLQVPRRKVSFADAFGLNLVSVKEFDNAEAAESDGNPPPGRDASLPVEELSVSCLFTVPSSPEELDQRLREQMVELESIELLPGTNTVRGNIRVVNLCYTKSVHVRMSLDRWDTHFDLNADYVPGSSDMRTDRFTFTYALVPPAQAEATRVELCLRYETPLGTFWANNKGMNYVLFCSRKVPVNGAQSLEDAKSKRSCLRASR